MRRAVHTLVAMAFAIFCTCAQAQVPEAWRLTGSHSFEEEQPGLGVSQRFTSSYGWIDVYVYGLKRDDWVDGTVDPQFESEFSAALASVRQAEANGITTGLVVGAPSQTPIGGQPFRFAVFKFKLRDRAYDSALFMTAKNGLLLKYRITIKAEFEPSLGALIEDFIAADVASRTPGH